MIRFARSDPRRRASAGKGPIRALFSARNGILHICPQILMYSFIHKLFQA